MKKPRYYLHKDKEYQSGYRGYLIDRSKSGRGTAISIAVFFDEPAALFICAALNGVESMVTFQPKKVFNCPKCEDKGIVRWNDGLGRQSYVCDCPAGKKVKKL
jgi:hypothetical protein